MKINPIKKRTTKEIMSEPTEPKIIKPCEWTDKDGYVLLVKCLNRDGTSHNGFVWPKAGPVKPDKWSRVADCVSGGLFGWPWGTAISDGRIADACAPWLVFPAKPGNVIDLSGKAKAVPGEDGELPEVVYWGDQAGSMSFTMFGRVQMVIAGASGSASATGERGSASATGWRGSASATGWSGSASATGWSGSASATGWSGSASATGWRGSASAIGEDGCAVSVGINSQAKGEKGVWLVGSEWKETEGQWHRVSVKTCKVDGKKIKADTWYSLKGGKFVAV